VEAPQGTDIAVAPEGRSTVRSGTPGIDRITHPPAAIRCGDPVNLQIFLREPGFDGALRVRFTAASDNSLVHELTVPVNGRLMVPVRWVSEKGDNVWTDAVDIRVSAQLRDSRGADAGTVFNYDGLHIVRYDAGVLENCISGGRRRGERWVADAAGTLVHQPDSPYGWPANYHLDYRDGVFTVISRIRLVPKRGLSITAAMKQQWKDEIERYWNDHWLAHRRRCGRGNSCDDDRNHHCCKYEVRIQCNFVDSDHLTSIDVYPGAATGPWGSFNWWYSTRWWENKSSNVPQAVRAHEFGHNVGLWDEYSTGAITRGIDPNTYSFNTTSIMNAGQRALANHFSGWLHSAGRLVGDRFRPIRI